MRFLAILKLHETYKLSVDQDSMAFCQNTKILRHTLILFMAHSLKTVSLLVFKAQMAGCLQKLVSGPLERDRGIQ